MANEQERITALFQKHIDRTATDDEQQEFLAYVDDPAYTDLIKDLIAEVYEQQDEPQGLSAIARTRVLNNIFEKTETVEEAPAKVVRLWPRIVAAASVLIMISIGGYFILHKRPTTPLIAERVKNDVAPGHQQATLTLANGQTIQLTKGLNGQLAKQNQTIVNATKNNIVYHTDDHTSGQEVYNTMSTANGEQSPYPLVLSDGTRVWLNAASSITFPVAFNGKQRLVKITGEAYLEVVHNTRLAFIVQTATQTIEDIGTSFDVNTYYDEPFVKTTLVEGAVSVKSNDPKNTTHNSVKLEPGQQSQLTANEFKVQAVNTSRVIAWKDGNFRFQNDDIQTIMRQLTRWYNIEVHYEGLPPADKFSGRISRNNPISAVLHMMELTNHVHFKVEERRVTVIR